MTTFTVQPEGAFELAESATFGFGHTVAPSFDGTMRMAFCADGYADHTAAAVSQDSAGVHITCLGEASPELTRDQVCRVLSLDHDGRVFAEIGRRDPVVGRLQAVAPGLRPPQFYSAYEAAAWALLSARRPARQMAEVRRRFAETYGRTFPVAGQQLAAFPTPLELLEVTGFDGVPPAKIERLHAVAQAALAGELDTAAIRREDPADAMARLQRLPGIGPFYSSLIVIRACGRADVLPDNEPRTLASAGELYGFGRPVTPAEIRELARLWDPMPTWVVVLIRAAARRLVAPE
jgi:DNA-3-methyladenine glycosylase II